MSYQCVLTKWPSMIIRFDFGDKKALIRTHIDVSISCVRVSNTEFLHVFSTSAPLIQCLVFLLYSNCWQQETSVSFYRFRQYFKDLLCDWRCFYRRKSSSGGDGLETPPIINHRYLNSHSCSRSGEWKSKIN